MRDIFPKKWVMGVRNDGEVGIGDGGWRRVGRTKKSTDCQNQVDERCTATSLDER